MNVEIGEEGEEHDGVEAHDVNIDPRIVTIDEEELCSVDENGDELDHLDERQVLLPPKIFLIFRSHGGQKVITVHDDVHKSVEQSKESSMSLIYIYFLKRSRSDSGFVFPSQFKIPDGT